MGCSKNLFDSERLLRRLEAKGYTVAHDSDDVCGSIAIVNTCGFIGDAKEESIDMILRLAEGKHRGLIGRLVVMGCLSERYREELRAEIPEVDEWYGKFDWDRIIDKLPDVVAASTTKVWERKLTTPPYSTFMKISEGCDRFCAYCAIPLITGRHKSRSIEEILEETQALVHQGVKEFNIIAQDLSAYGTDLYGRHALAELVERMSDMRGVEWLRLHYAYPVDFPYDVLRVMRERPNVCNYLDMALQHISTPVLANMRRHIDAGATRELIQRIRDEVPGIRLRTTLMTGFPGEGDREFRELLEFMDEVKFDRLGAFAYCQEDDTWAARHLKDDIPEDVKRHRLDIIMERQKEISYELHQKLIGTVQRVLIDEVEPEWFVGRTQWDSPEVDPQVLVCRDASSEGITAGDFVDVSISSADAFELTGKIVI